jgi:hypothetical protein
MKARFILNLPVAVFRNRLAAPRFVFSFGMISSEAKKPRHFPSMGNSTWGPGRSA